jgi:hypothetical protein
MRPVVEALKAYMTREYSLYGLHLLETPADESERHPMSTMTRSALMAAVFVASMLGGAGAVGAKPGPGIRSVDFANYTYPLDCGSAHSITVVGGQWQDPQGPESGDVNVTRVQYLRATGRSQDDAVVEVNCSIGAGNVAPNVFVFTMVNGKVKETGQFIGSKPSLDNKRLGTLVLWSPLPGANDPACCPSQYQRIVRRYEASIWVQARTSVRSQAQFTAASPATPTALPAPSAPRQAKNACALLSTSGLNSTFGLNLTSLKVLPHGAESCVWSPSATGGEPTFVDVTYIASSLPDRGAIRQTSTELFDSVAALPGAQQSTVNGTTQPFVVAITNNSDGSLASGTIAVMKSDSDAYSIRITPASSRNATAQDITNALIRLGEDAYPRA